MQLARFNRSIGLLELLPQPFRRSPAPQKSSFVVIPQRIIVYAVKHWVKKLGVGTTYSFGRLRSSNRIASTVFSEETLRFPPPSRLLAARSLGLHTLSPFGVPSF